LLDMDVPKAQQANVGHILRAGQHLLTLINEVLDIAKIEAGSLALNIAPIALAGALQEALTLVSPMAADAGVQLQPLPALAADTGIVADRQRLTQVLLNLLSNAIKYNRRKGQVSLEVGIQGQRISVSVCDTGNGIAADHIGRLFKPFERLGADPNVEGSGLGLALSKSLLENMDGQLKVQSQPGIGSRFTLELPFVHVAHAHSSATPGIDIDIQVKRPAPVVSTFQGKVLCIEHNLSSLALIETLLQRRPGIRLLSSMQGQLGLDLAAQHAPQLILLDVSLPDIDGLKVLQRLRQSPISRDTPVLMITADASHLTRQALLQAGATAVLNKPINVPGFLTHLDQAFPEPA
jgi:CheY-like chemotaxis protein/anti-sigma regulatory factor (Ser/Thr protein kinase)